MQKTAAFVAALFISLPASAAPSWGPLEQISSIESSPSGIFIASPTYSACGSTQTIVTLADSQAVKQLYATALTAYVAGRPVRLLTDGCIGPYYRLLGISL
jgi:hypothetical protein